MTFATPDTMIAAFDLAVKTLCLSIVAVGAAALVAWALGMLK